MKFLAKIDVMPLKELLDPQGKTVGKNMTNIGIAGIDEVRIGKHIEFTIDANDEASAKVQVEEACKKILANLIMESYSFSIVQV